MKIILLGAPGSGKGTQSNFITSEYGLKKISTGDILRSYVKKNNILGNKIKQIMKKGEFVSDEIMIYLIKNIIKKNTCKDFLFDGFPRNIFQATALKNFGIKINYVIELIISNNDIIDRIKGRLIHESSGRIYHKIYNPPKLNCKDDITGDILTLRGDDKKNVIKKRLTEYNKFNKSLVNFYIKESKLNNIMFHRINANNSITEINNKLKKILG